MTFKPGDVVMLNSGGPWMTVDSVDHLGIVHCIWHDMATLLVRDGFRADNLQLAPTDQDIIDEVFGEGELEGATRN